MRNALALLFLALMSVAVLAQERDLSTDEAVRKAYSDETGGNVRADHFGVKRPASFPKVIACAVFAHDYGMKAAGLFVEGAYHRNAGEAAKAGLASAGWEKADKAGREKLALSWVKEVLFAFHPVLEKAPAGFGGENGPKFEAPLARTEGEQVLVKVWWRHPSGMMPETRYSQLEFEFGKDGAQTGRKTLAEHVEKR